MQEADFARLPWQQLCPVLWSIPGGWLVVMQRARVMTAEEFRSTCVEALINPPGTNIFVPAELKPDSFGYLEDGRLVAIDYGS